MRTICLYSLIATAVIFSMVIADDNNHTQEEDLSNTKSWLKGLLTSIFGDSGNTTSKDVTKSTGNESTISGNQTPPDNVTSTVAVNNTTALTTSLIGQSTTDTIGPTSNTTTSEQTNLDTTTTISGSSSGNIIANDITHTTSPEGSTTTRTNGATGTTSGSSSATDTTKQVPGSKMWKEKKQNCLIDVRLDKFCILPPPFIRYLDGNTSVDMVYSKMFSESLITRLRDQCVAGEWCLPEDQLSHFASKKNEFYKGPLCDDGFVECLSVIAKQYQGCPIRHKVIYMANSLSLLCGMKILNTNLTEKCFGETMSNLHLTRATILHMKNSNENGSRDNITDFCSTPAAKMTKNYMCNIERCPDVRIMLMSFYPWQWFLRLKPSPAEYCSFVQPCGVDTYAESMTTTSSTGKPSDSEEHSFFYVVTGDDSTSLVVGIATGTLMALVGITILVCAVHKRARRANGALVKNGYSMLPNDEEP